MPSEQSSGTKPGDKMPLPGDGDSAAQLSGPKGDNPGTAGAGNTPENRPGHVNPSPEDTRANFLWVYREA
jgi:hypothetical protein